MGLSFSIHSAQFHFEDGQGLPGQVKVPQCCPEAQAHPVVGRWADSLIGSILLWPSPTHNKYQDKTTWICRTLGELLHPTSSNRMHNTKI